MFALFIPAFLGALATITATLVGRAILAAGISFVTFTGITILISTFKGQVISSIGGMPGDVVGLLGFLWVDKALTLIFSATVAAIAVRQIGGTWKKLVFK